MEKRYEKRSPSDFSCDVWLGDGGLPCLRRLEKRLLLSSRTRKLAAGSTYRAVAGFELPGLGVPGDCCGSCPWGWPPGHPDLLQHLPQPGLHHYAAATFGRNMGSRGEQDE